MLCSMGKYGGNVPAKEAKTDRIVVSKLPCTFLANSYERAACHRRPTVRHIDTTPIKSTTTHYRAIVDLRGTDDFGSSRNGL
ncbi:hypothetical protein HBH70_031610 [Parastagonospora nodorum]|nr:hypothetical protein HBH49_110490 [Parastagonospora nodorum]KAH4127051.1 hypothetical protein HBH47_049060 [Parastagonospora nodorum]KAH4690265.1 hypothetical protein HBH78_088770 [Parastagonospora nodorum]KAH4796691.1 hypothetical protein HBH63_079720 [Parastagonospora nodorum]KAH5148808.1 hypothetical protein HBH70_031610 [Parastagonospora nodorum]